jgi:NAD(P)-dependent dehydrogenase (short-subunit alcohol dehydrogenase family)
MAALIGKVAIVTHAASGIGKETALRFARESVSVVATDPSGDGRVIVSGGSSSLAG